MNKKPLWKRSFDDAVFADFLDGRGIVLQEPNGEWRQARQATNWPEYHNNQKSEEYPHATGDLNVHYWQGSQFNFILSPNQTKKWNDYHGFTPLVVDQREEKKKRIRERMRDQERDYVKALALVKQCRQVLATHETVMIRLQRELDALDQEDSE